MPRYRGLGYGPNHVRAGFIGHGGRGRGFLRGRVGISLSRATPLAIRGPPDGNYEDILIFDPIEVSPPDEAYEQIEDVNPFEEVHGALPVAVAPRGQQAENGARRIENGSAGAPQHEHVAIPYPVAPPGVSQQARNSGNRVENGSSSNPGVLPISPPESPYSSTSPSYSSSSSSSTSSYSSFEPNTLQDVSDSSTSSDSSTESGSSDTDSDYDHMYS